MTRYQQRYKSNEQLDSYEAQIVEDIPEQFDPNRYINNKHQNQLSAQYEQRQVNPVANRSHSYTPNYNPQPDSYAYSNANRPLTNNIYQYKMPAHQLATAYQTLQHPKNLIQHGASVQQQQQQMYQQMGYQGMRNISYQYPATQSMTGSHAPTLQRQSNYQNGSSMVQQQQEKHNFCTFDQKPGFGVAQNLQPQTQQPIVTGRAQSETRKKYTFEDEDSDMPYSKKEYFLKGGDDVVESKTWMMNRQKPTESVGKVKNLDGSYSRSDPDIVDGKGVKKHGVTFDEKLEVHEVKNPHYGVDVKSEKREMKKKKKDRRKEEDIIIKVRTDMKLKVQGQNMILFNFYEKTLLYNALVFYEENYYRASIIKLQEKLRNTNKTDEKLKEQLMQLIHKDNQITVDIIKYLKKDYVSRLEPYCQRFNTSLDKLHNFPGMYQVIQNAANLVNYKEIINHYAAKDLHSPSGLKKILGHDTRLEKLLNLQTPIKPATQRKADLWLPKNTLAAIDMHVREIALESYKTLTELIFKLNEVCENELHTTRAIYKYILTTQLDSLRRNKTGALLMVNYDVAIESTNTIFSRLCSFAGIENQCLRGLWKTIALEPGEKVDSRCLWNIVNIESAWRFIQPSFTPVKHFSNPDTLTYEESEYYFLSDADTLFNEFLPQDKLVPLSTDSNLNVKEFERRPILTPHFRNLNLSIVPLTSNITPNLDQRDPFKLTLRFPKEHEAHIHFKYSLRPIANTTLTYPLPNSFQHRDLTHHDHLNLFVIAELIAKENSILFKITALPQTGSYNFTVYAGLSDEAFTADTDFPLASTNLLLKSLNVDLKAVASLRLTCAKATYFDLPPNHISQISIFGTNNIMRALGLVCHDFTQGVLGPDRDGKVHLVFEMSQPLDVEAFLYSSDPSISDKYLELCVLKRTVHNFLVLIVQPPHPGLYGLDLHASPKNTFSPIPSIHTQLPPVGKYLIKSYHQLRSFVQFPRGDNRDWGPKQRFYDLGLHAVTHTDPYVINDDGKQIEIELGLLRPLTMWYRLYYDHNGTPHDVSHFAFMNYKNSDRREKTVSLLLRFPHRGFYHLALMATDVYPSRPDEIVYNYLIRVQDPGHEVEPFPVVVNPILWKNCCLVAPKSARLNSYDVHFSVLVSGTSQVIVTSGDRIIEKLEAREIENSWVGLVSLNEYVNTKFVYIEAEFDNKYKKLVKFKGLRDSSDTALNEDYFD